MESFSRPAPADSDQPSLEGLVEGVVAADRTALGRAITLLESRLPEDQERAGRLLDRLQPRSGGALRLGITGPPGVGKSTLIETLGARLVREGRRLAVLAIDPTSSQSGGSILADKTRMTELSRLPGAFVRPSPTGGDLGGVTRRTRETLLLCEAAGFDTVFVETVGVGQSETRVAEIVDTVLLLLQPGAGDELQGLKRGILELADVVVVHKADGESRGQAEETHRQFASSLRLLRPQSDGWRPPVLLCSSREGRGLEELWRQVVEHRRHLEAGGGLEQRRREQRRRWLWSMIDERLAAGFRSHPEIAPRWAEIERRVADSEIDPRTAAAELLELYAGQRPD